MRWKVAQAIRAPMTGATQKSPNCPGAPLPLMSATAVGQAGLTEVFEMGMEVRGARVTQRPMARGANHVGALSLVSQRMTSKKNTVGSTSAHSTASRE